MYYIEPSAVCFRGNTDDKEDILKFLDAFEEMQSILASQKEHIIIDKVLGSRIMPMTGKGLIPMSISDITSEDIRAKVLRLQQSFYTIFNPLACFIDTEGCSCVQDIVIEPKESQTLLELEDYFDFIHSLVGECYRKDKQSQFILVIPEYTQIGIESIRLNCKCEKNDFNKSFYCRSIHSLEDKKGKLIQVIGQALKGVSKKKKEQIKVTQASHHPVMSNTIIHSYSEIPSKFRRVLDLLVNFGLGELELRDWKKHSGKTGSIVNCMLIPDKADGGKQIIEGWLIIEDQSCKVVMYFEKEIGSLLLNYLGKKWEYNNVMHLYELVM